MGSSLAYSLLRANDPFEVLMFDRRPKTVAGHARWTSEPIAGDWADVLVRLRGCRAGR